jgi:hypothetical protein
MINWKKGIKLVCIKSFRGINKMGQKLSFVPPQKDRIYTFGGVKGYDDTFSCWYILLEEFPGTGGYNHSHFKPLKDVFDTQSEELIKELEEEINQEQLIEYEK